MRKIKCKCGASFFPGQAILWDSCLYCPTCNRRVK